MPRLSIDLSAASSGSGTRESPFNSFAPINSAGWNDDDLVVELLYGSQRVVDTATRANIVRTSGAGRLLITAYGEPGLPLPCIDGGGTTFNPLWVREGSGIDIERVHVTNAPGTCLAIEPPVNTAASISDVSVCDSLLTRCGQNPALKGVDGLRVGSITWQAGTVSNVRLKRNVARDNGGHGIKVRGHAFDVWVEDCVGLRNGSISPSHALGTSGSFVQLAGSGWVNVGGDVWEKAVSVPGSASFTGWRFVHVLGASPIYSLFPGANPASPTPGQCGHGAPNTIRVNLAGVNPNTLPSIAAHFNGPDRVWFLSSVGANTVDADGIEGQGVYFDSGSFSCWSINCASLYNEGPGYQTNQTAHCGHYLGLAAGNGRAGAVSGASTNTEIHGMVLLADGVPGISYVTGNSGGRVRRNRIVGASVGLQANDLATNELAEDENLYVGCGQRLLNVSAPGARSQDLAFAAAELRASQQLAWAMRRLAWAESVR